VLVRCCVCIRDVFSCVYLFLLFIICMSTNVYLCVVGCVCNCFRICVGGFAYVFECLCVCVCLNVLVVSYV